MKYVTIIKDSVATYEIRYMEDSVVFKVIGGVFEHDLTKFIKDRFYDPPHLIPNHEKTYVSRENQAGYFE